MIIPLVLRTVGHLRPTQMFYQLLYRVRKVPYMSLEAPITAAQGHRLSASPIPRENCLKGRVFSFLNLSHEFAGWGFNEFGNLWTYNQNYFDWLNQKGMSEEGRKWIDRFIEEVLRRPTAPRMSLDPYPIALRSINWIKFFCRYPESATKERLDALWSQLVLLSRKLEYHLLANHLLEDAFALYIGAAYFNDRRLLEKASKLLLEQLREQILPDGAHFEQSPMYHCIMLDRLLDCCNILPTDSLKDTACLMLGHLESIVWRDGSIPLLNDSAYGIAPTPEQLFDYARRLGIEWKAIPLGECGFRKMQNSCFEVTADIGEITATYQPGHTHADLFSYVLRIDGKDVVVDTGISTYDKTPRRQYERSTRAHNTVSVGGKDSFEVWGGFRVGRRARVSVETDEPGLIRASHDGFGKTLHSRWFKLQDDFFAVQDFVSGGAEATSYIHLAPGAFASLVGDDTVDCGDFSIVCAGASSVTLREDRVSTRYNQFEKSIVVEVAFAGEMSYSISKNEDSVSD